MGWSPPLLFLLLVLWLLWFSSCFCSLFYSYQSPSLSPSPHPLLLHRATLACLATRDHSHLCVGTRCISHNEYCRMNTAEWIWHIELNNFRVCNQLAWIFIDKQPFELSSNLPGMAVKWDILKKIISCKTLILLLPAKFYPNCPVQAPEKLLAVLAVLGAAWQSRSHFSWKLKEPIRSCKSQFMTTGAKLWLQD